MVQRDAIALRDLEAQTCIDTSDSLAGSLGKESVERISQNGNTYSVGIIEFTDSGELANDAQKKAVFDMIRTEAATPTGAEIIVFAHGWHHSASVCDENLACFRRVLGERADRTTRTVIGVYLGWRGGQFQKADYVSIFYRKKIAQRIGRAAGLETLLELADLRNELDKNKNENKKQIRLIVVGHSLGGALVFTAAQEVLKQAKNRDVVLFGDLVILVNPAVEAYEYEGFHQRPERQEPSGIPKMIIFASEADNAMGWVFSAERFIQLLWKPHHALRRGNFAGIGRYDRHLTHRLTLPGERPLPNVKRSACECSHVTREEETSNPPDLERVDGMRGEQKRYWVVRTNGSVIRTHNDIYNPRFVRFIQELLSEPSIYGEGLLTTARSGSPDS